MMRRATDTGRESLTLWDAHNGKDIATRIAVAGDFLPAGNLELPAAGSWIEMASALYPHFADVATTFVNLECSIDVAGLRAQPLDEIGTIVSAPSDALAFLSALRVRAVGIANNHIYDFGAAGAIRTREAATNLGFVPLGAGHSLTSAPETFVWHGPHNLRVGFWAAAKAARELATKNRDGVEPATPRRARAAIAAMKAQGTSFCVALLHAGCLRTNQADPEDVALLDSIADAGFDLCVASHSHRVSGGRTLPRSSGTPAFCFYGLGSIVSGYIASEPEREGLIVVAGFDANGGLSRVEVRPVYIANNGFGEKHAHALARQIIDRFEELSRELDDDSYKKAFYRDVSNGLARLYLRDLAAAFRERGLTGISRKAGRIRLRHVRRLFHRVLPT